MRFARSADGTRIAWARTGEGPPLIRTSHFLGHVEADWRCPAFAAAYAHLSGSCTLIRYDQRGGGLSDRDPPSLDLERHADDLEAVADAAGLERFALYGGSQGAPISIAFALRRPERVSRLVLYGGFARGRLMRGDPEAEAQAETVLGMIRAGWGAPEGPFLQAFASLYMPDATPEQLAGMVDLQRASASPDGAARIRRAVDRFDVSARLAELRVPTLVIHCTRDGVHPFAEGRRIAEHVSEAEFLPIESRNHVLLPQDPNWAALDAILAFALAGEGERA